MAFKLEVKYACIMVKTFKPHRADNLPNESHKTLLINATLYVHVRMVAREHYCMYEALSGCLQLNVYAQSWISIKANI